MDNYVIISSISSNEILVYPILTGHCINCHDSSCTKRGKTFTVSNPMNLPISVGSTVKLKTNSVFATLQSFIALILPILGAFLGYFVSNKLIAKYNLINIELVQVSCILLGLFVTAFIIFLISSNLKKITKSEIVEVINPQA